MEKLRLGEILQAVQGELQGEFADLSLEIAGVSTDTRNILPTDVFFALVGERFDAHDFLSAPTQGLGFVISQDLACYDPNKFYIKVADTQKALGDLAKWYRKLFSIPFIVVTGSVGKTTAKEMISATLSAGFSVHKTEGNFNNTIGLPLTLLKLEKTHQICVLEMGMDTPGEIGYMAELVRPNMAVITNIGDAHVERLGSREGIRQAKLELLPYLAPDALLFLNGDDSFLLEGVTERLPLTVGEGDACLYQAKQVEVGSAVSMTVDTLTDSAKVTVPAMGRHMIYPTLFAFAIGENLGMSLSQIQAGIASFSPTKMRMQPLELGRNITFLDDTYNANPQSMKAGIGILSQFTGRKRIAVLGDMLELGEYSQALHQEVAVYLVEKQIDILLTIGKEATHMAEKARELGMKEVYSQENSQEARKRLGSLISSDSVVLFKASRGMALDLLLQEVASDVKASHLTT